MAYNPQAIEKKWRKIWEETGIFQVDLQNASKPHYNLMMFPYPSAEGLHVGNVYAFTGSDIHGRFRRMQGFDVFEPIGFDAFGIHSENFAIKKRIHPRILIRKNINNFRQQLKNLGCLFDWRHEIDTTNPNYYKWTQWLFIQLFKAGLAHRKKAPVDWCPSCKTVLADEQVINGRCERCDSLVIQKETEQWFFKITNYAEKLLKNLGCLSAGALGPNVEITKQMAEAGIDWSERTKFSQRNWISRSEGTEIKFPICPLFSRSNFQFPIDVFTTRPDTLFGCTYLVLAPEHPIIENLKPQILNLKDVEKYIKESKKKTERERISEIKNKTGIELKGVKAINPINDSRIPIFVADYVLFHYGTGAIMAVPAHDQRDLDFARKYNLAVIEVIKPNFSEKKSQKVESNLAVSGAEPEEAYEGEGTLINSGKFNGLNSQRAKEKITEWLSKKGQARKTVYYKLRDWLISRQRYWGAPIPMIFCEKCGWQSVKEQDLPVLLPYVKNFRPRGTGVSPLASVKSFVNTKCPNCSGPARRETDVCDTFLDSSWYFFRYPSTDFDNKPLDQTLTKKWLPVNMYIGGQEHAVLHLMYSRFISMVLYDLGFTFSEEPFQKFRAHGLLTKGGAKMSKSKGNVVNPDEYYKKYGADTLRVYLMFLGPFEKGGDWQNKGIMGSKRFLDRIYALAENLKIKNKKPEKIKIEIENQDLKKIIHKTIKKITDDLENLQYNTALSALMVLLNNFSANIEQLTNESFKTLLILLAPFAPYIAEELWPSFAPAPALKDKQFDVKNSVHNQPWPKYDLELVKEKMISLVIQVNGKVRDKIEIEVDITEKVARELALSRDKIKKWLAGKEIKKVIFVPGKLINFVV